MNTIAKMEEGSKGGFNMQIGERIRCLRISKGLTQYDLAQAIHISSSFMNRIEKGSSTVSIEYVCSIANALDVTPQDILCDIVNIGLHFILKNVRPYAAPCSEA